jgi:hypothetical protein
VTHAHVRRRDEAHLQDALENQHDLGGARVTVRRRSASLCDGLVQLQN